MLDAAAAAKRIAAAEESAAVNLRLYAQECARTKAAEQLAAEVNEEARSRLAEVTRLRSERDALTVALERCRQVSDGRAADLTEARRELERLRPKGSDPITAPRPDADEAARLLAELDRTKRALSAAHDRLAEYRDREEVSGRG